MSFQALKVGIGLTSEIKITINKKKACFFLKNADNWFNG
jgi:hypothetical protein